MIIKLLAIQINEKISAQKNIDKLMKESKQRSLDNDSMLLIQDQSSFKAFNNSIRKLHIAHIISKILGENVQFGSNVEVLDCAALFCPWVGTLIRKDELCHFEDGI